MNDSDLGKRTEYKIFPNGQQLITEVEIEDTFSWSGKQWKTIETFKECFPEDQIIWFHTGTQGENILQYVLKVGEQEIAEYLIDCLSRVVDENVRRDVLNHTDGKRKDTALMYAIASCPQVVDKILKLKPDLSIVNVNGDIALNIIEDDFPTYKKIFEYIKKNDRSIFSIVNTRGRNCFMRAIYDKQKEYVELFQGLMRTNKSSDNIFSLLSTTCVGENILQMSGFNGDVEVLAYLADCIKEIYGDQKLHEMIEAHNIYGCTILHQAARHGISGKGNLDMVQYIVKNYAHYSSDERSLLPPEHNILHPCRRDNRGYTAMHYACILGDGHTNKKQPTRAALEYLLNYVDVNDLGIGVQPNRWMWKNNQERNCSFQVKTITARKCFNETSAQECIEQVKKLGVDFVEKAKDGAWFKEDVGDYPTLAQIKNKCQKMIDEIKQILSENKNLISAIVDTIITQLNKELDKYGELGYELNTPLAIAITFRNVDTIDFLISGKGALFDITALRALHKLEKSQKFSEGYDAVCEKLIALKIASNDKKAILENTYTIINKVDLEKYWTTEEVVASEESIENLDEKQPSVSTDMLITIGNFTTNDLSESEESEVFDNNKIENKFGNVIEPPTIKKISGNTIEVSTIKKLSLSIALCLCTSAIIIAIVLTTTNVAKKVELTALFSSSVVIISFLFFASFVFYVVPDRYFSCDDVQKVTSDRFVFE